MRIACWAAAGVAAALMGRAFGRILREQHDTDGRMDALPDRYGGRLVCCPDVEEDTAVGPSPAGLVLDRSRLIDWSLLGE